jgi:XTP/dITP diphosphohydrolase
MERILRGVGVGVEIATPSVKIDVPETESTFAGNALLKARAYSAALGAPALADDSGLCVDALGGLPGVLSARWAGADLGEAEKDAKNLSLLLDHLAGMPGLGRGARFVCAVALVLPDGSECCEEGEVLGEVITTPRGANGFGYDPVFLPSGFDITTAQMTDEQKDEISHRGRALRKLVERGVFG